MPGHASPHVTKQTLPNQQNNSLKKEKKNHLSRIETEIETTTKSGGKRLDDACASGPMQRARLAEQASREHQQRHTRRGGNMWTMTHRARVRHRKKRPTAACAPTDTGSRPKASLVDASAGSATRRRAARAPSQGPPFGARAPVSLRDEPQTTLRANTMPSECQVTLSKAHSVARARGHVTRSQH